MSRIKKGDRVMVLSGKDRGKVGEVMRSLPSAGKVIVDGVNVAKRHQRPTQSKRTQRTMQGGIIDKSMPLPVSAVAIVCGRCGPTRIGARLNPDGRKVRVCRKCGGDL
jgi:large subunit ribosomal protein L24